MTVRILNCDVMEGLAQLPDESVHCVVTSPPYFGLRDYGVAGQIGLEPTPDAFVTRLVEVFREVRRVLRKEGTCWVNMGDSYAGGGCGSRDPERWPKQSRNDHMPTHAKRSTGLKSKDLIGVPWMLAFALRADGWYLRQDIIWSKPNPMPESVTDRCTKAHEYVFLLTKSARYFYDAEAIKETAAYDGPNSPESIASPYGQGFTRRAKRQRTTSYETFGRGPQDGGNKGLDALAARMNAGEHLGRNKRSVWSIATAPFPEAHFATFPPELPEICIKAGCPKGGTVLDPFGGAGTTGLVADRLQRNAILIELNPEYAAMAERRISNDRGGLLDLLEAAE